MNDTEYGLYRALYFYKKTRDGSSYQEVFDALKACIEEDCNGWLAARIEKIDNREMVKPGVVTGDDDKPYYIMCPAEDDMGQMDEQGLDKIHVNLRAVVAYVEAEKNIAGICLNPWDGGCFISREELLAIK